MHQPSDSELIQRHRDGDSSALGELLTRHQPRLYNVALRMVSNRDDAAEVTQDAMLKIIQHLDSFRSEAQVTTWMTRIVMNQSISRLRRRRLRDHASIDTPRFASADNDNTGSLAQIIENNREPQPDHRVEQDEMIQCMLAAIDLLEDDHKAVLILRDLQDMDYQAIAETLELKTGTVKSRLFRARIALRQEMQKITPAPASRTTR